MRDPGSLALPRPLPQARGGQFFIRVGDHLALDFLNTVAAPRGAPIESIGSGHAFLDWLVGSSALAPADAEHVAARWPSVDLDRVAREAVALREWFRTLVARAKVGGLGTLTDLDVEPLNCVLARDVVLQRVEPTAENARMSLVAYRLWNDPGELLAPVATAMADLLCTGDFDLVRRCENPLCTLWFYDRTKGHRRRWCSQAVCGNRAKVAAYRDRKSVV